MIPVIEGSHASLDKGHRGQVCLRECVRVTNDINESREYFHTGDAN